MNVFAIICLILWLYALSVFKRGKLDFFRYLTGSVGLFVFMMIFLEPLLIQPLVSLVTSVTGIVGDVTGLFESYHDYSIIFVTSNVNHESLSLYIDYECSGIIEMMAFVSLLAFFEVYDVWQRVVVGVLGCIAIFFSNVLRITVICVIIKVWGNSAYYFAHTIVGRIVFYLLTIVLYYYVFTHAQIIRQKIGGFNYAAHNESSDK
ncbi:MAG: exosortase family protein XrtG [Lachnospiraceae bacterium]